MATGTDNLDPNDDEEWETDINNNLTYLTKNISSLTEILISLIERKIISETEREIILNECVLPTTMDKNFKLLSTLRKKGWSIIRFPFIQILRDTGNDKCADIIEYGEIQQDTLHKYIKSTVSIKKEKVFGRLISKWWPEEKKLPNSFLARKTGDEFLTEKLKAVLTQNENKMTVINQQVAVSGLGGIGKTTAAKSFAKQYENDYDFILWIDCGEGSLFKSFKNLARDLGVPKMKELDIQQLAYRSLEILKEFKILLIYDNAECYLGHDGIRDALPKNHYNFHVLITSRNRKWSSETGDGKIPQFQLNVFDEKEGVEFMKKNIKELKPEEEMLVQPLCDNLGYLPLALQIAVATLNQRKISLKEYIDKIKITEDILHIPFDDYEKTINKTMQISLPLIEKFERKLIGEKAIQILTIFGFITPDDVSFRFFIAMQNEQKSQLNTLLESIFVTQAKKEYEMKMMKTELKKRRMEIEDAIHLLESYSLISVKKTSIGELRLSIHRLFQQVIRHNTLSKKRNTILTKVLKCEGFFEYKIIPFCYADSKLQKQFPKIRAELMVADKLVILLKEKKFQAAVELARFIRDTLQTPASEYNLAMSLKYNHEISEANNILVKLLKNAPYIHVDNHQYFSQFGLIRNLQAIVATQIINTQLYHTYCLMKDDENAEAVPKCSVWGPLP